MADRNFIYLDNAATTIPDREVVALYNEIELNHFGNSGSIHKLGIDSLNYLNKARQLILNTFGLKGYKVYFTSSSTEANNLAIKGYARKYSLRGKHLITSNIEHPSVLECFKQLEKEGFEVTYLQVNEEGIITPEQLESAIRKDTILVSIMGTNNEIGSMNPIKDLAAVVHKNPKIAFHVDTTQDIGKRNLNYSDIDMFVVSGHKIHGLKGSGALIAKQSLSFEPVISGGGQEDGYRSGTVSVALACSLALAVKKCYPIDMEVALDRQEVLFEEMPKLPGISINSSRNSSPFIFNFSLTEKKASVVVEALSNKNIYVSSVSACHSKGEAGSYVVAALGKTERIFHNTIRVSLSRDSSVTQVEIFIMELRNILETIK